MILLRTPFNLLHGDPKADNQDRNGDSLLSLSRSPSSYPLLLDRGFVNSTTVQYFECILG